MTTPRLRAIRYLRMSSGKDYADDYATQDDLTAKVIEQRDYDLIHTFSETVSATKGLTRKEFVRLIAFIEDHDIDVIVVQITDRLYRTNAEGLPFKAAAFKAGARLIAAATGSDVVLGDADSQLFDEIITAMGHYGVSANAKKLAQQQARVRAAGDPPTTILFGYERTREDTPDGKGRPTLTPVPAEEAVIKDAVSRVLRGESFRSVTLDLNAQGVRTRGGGPFRPHTLRRLTSLPSRFAGYRLLDDDTRAEGKWPAIIDREDHERLLAIAKTNAATRQLKGPHSTATTHALSGVLRCGRCGSALRHHGRSPRDNNGHLYRCTGHDYGRAAAG